MASFMISGSRGTDDPTMATLPFMAAKTAKEQGHDVVLWLWNEAVTLGRKGTAEHVVGVNLTPLKELLAAVQARDSLSKETLPAPSPFCAAAGRHLTERRRPKQYPSRARP